MSHPKTIRRILLSPSPTRYGNGGTRLLRNPGTRKDDRNHYIMRHGYPIFPKSYCKWLLWITDADTWHMSSIFTPTLAGRCTRPYWFSGTSTHCWYECYTILPQTSDQWKRTFPSQLTTKNADSFAPKRPPTCLQFHDKTIYSNQLRAVLDGGLQELPQCLYKYVGHLR
jgi:hypothetical protein